MITKLQYSVFILRNSRKIKNASGNNPEAFLKIKTNYL